MKIVALTSGDFLLEERAAATGFSFPLLALAERHVGDLTEAGAVVVQRSDMAPIQLLEAGSEIVGAMRHQPRQHRVNLVLGGEEGVQGGVIGLGHDGPRVGYEDMTALVCPLVMVNRTRNVPRASGISVSHGCCTEEIGTVVSLWNHEETCCSALQRKKRPVERSVLA